jgi:hypothetical protein
MRSLARLPGLLDGRPARIGLLSCRAPDALPFDTQIMEPGKLKRARGAVKAQTARRAFRRAGRAVGRAVCDDRPGGYRVYE